MSSLIKCLVWPRTSYLNFFVYCARAARQIERQYLCTVVLVNRPDSCAVSVSCILISNYCVYVKSKRLQLHLKLLLETLLSKTIKLKSICEYY